MKIGIVGCSGRVGKLLVEELQSDEWKSQGLELAGGTSRKSSDATNSFLITDNPEKLFQLSDAIIDFTSPTSTRKNIELAIRHKKTLIIGTTGLNTDDEEAMKKASNSSIIIYSANMSIGVNMLMALVEHTSKRLLKDWDIEIFESHHKHKIDSPSGTALALGKSAAKGRSSTLDELACFSRHGITEERQEGKIGFSVARGGDVVGEHTVFFFGQGERLELTHRATNRSLFARGALKAALWSKGKQAGLYSMRDVLGL